MTVPARKKRWNRLKRTARLVRTTIVWARRARRRGQPDPLQRTMAVPPAGELTDRRRMRAPRRVTMPFRRTIGNGRRSRSGLDAAPAMLGAAPEEGRET